MKTIKITIDDDRAEIVDKGCAQVDRLLGLSILAQQIRAENGRPRSYIDGLIMKAVSHGFTDKLLREVKK